LQRDSKKDFQRVTVRAPLVSFSVANGALLLDFNL
jgi:hypothetical protein